MSSNMNRRPSLFRRTPPSPRTPSVTRMPRTLGGQTMPVGWNWMNSMVLQRADHLQPGTIADVRQAGIAMPAEVTLQDAAGLGAIEHGAPGFQFAHARRRFLGVQLGHAPVVDVLSASHRVGKVNF